MASLLNQKNTNIIVLTIFLFVIYFTLTKIINKNSLNLYKSFLQRNEEGGTELYFSDHLNLPKNIEIGKDYPFEFTVRNLEYEKETYKYDVVVSENGNDTIVDSGEFVIENDTTNTISINLSMLTHFVRGKMTVRLMNKNEEISFWFEEAL